MRPTVKYAAGKRFHSLTIIEPLPNRMARCRCDCGNETVVRRKNMNSGNTQTCGCGQTKAVNAINKARGQRAMDELLRLVGSVRGYWLVTGTKAKGECRNGLDVACAICGYERTMARDDWLAEVVICCRCRSIRMIVDDRLFYEAKRYELADGYRCIWVGSRDLRHPGAHVGEHRLVMERHLGRMLDRNEVVHHRNEDRLDNRLENLELVNGSGKHIKLHRGWSPDWNGLSKAKFGQRFVSRWQYDEMCACGCGQTFPAFRMQAHYAYLRHFAKGHHSRPWTTRHEQSR